ncbi:MAG: glycoside hydrolase family 2 TIM barrel-domain containing protein [Patescibacteria group bacterium]
MLYFFIGSTSSSENISWGISFSQMQAENLGLAWKKTYLAVLDDLGVKNIKLHTQWDWVEGKRDKFYFNDIDWQIERAKEHGVNIIYVVGMKTGRWPECHLPQWASLLSKQEQQEELLQYIKEVVLRYKNQNSIVYWQVENEPLFKFGECPWYDRDFLKKEVQLVKSIDPTRKVIVSDSGELSTWIRSASIGDVLGVTIYRKVWTRIADGYGFYWTSIFPPISYFKKAELFSKLYNKKVICVELQAEPWTLKPFFDVPLSEQQKTMNLEQFRKNIDFAKKTGLDEFYFWGTEWWYWLKEKHNKPEIWDEARKLFQDS